MTSKNQSAARAEIPFKDRPLDMLTVAFFVVNLLFAFSDIPQYI